MRDSDNDAARPVAAGWSPGSHEPARPRPEPGAVALEVVTRLIEKPWGGRRLDPGGTRVIGESWLYVPGGETASIVRGGEGDGQRIDQFMQQPPQVLVKILDCERELSLQVHRQKWEGWLTLASSADATITSGLRAGVDIAQLESSLAPGASQSLRPLLRTVHLDPGDFLANPPGTLHAIGGGHLVLEVQSPQDETLRISDWDRTDTDGTPRELHVAQGLAIIDPELRPEPLPAAATARRVTTADFTIELPSGDGRRIWIEGDGWQMLVTCEDQAQPALRLWCHPSLFAGDDPCAGETP